MRRVGLAIMGLLGGAFLGFAVAFTGVYLWYEVLDLGHPDEAKPGLGAILIAAPLAMLGFGVLGIRWAHVREDAGLTAIPVIMLGLLGIVLIFLIGKALGLV